MAAEKTVGIILRVTEFSETSCIASVLTRDFGTQSVIAKGARRPKSPFESSLDLLAVSRIVFIPKPGGALGILTEAKLVQRFRNRRRQMSWLYAAYYVVELLRLLTEEGDSNPELFDLSLAVLRMIDPPDWAIENHRSGPGIRAHRDVSSLADVLEPISDRQVRHDCCHDHQLSYRSINNQTAPLRRLTASTDAGDSSVRSEPDELDLILLRFEAGLLQSLGLFPLLSHCASCGRPRKTSNPVVYAAELGGVICPPCVAKIAGEGKQSQSFPVSPRLLELLRRWQEILIGNMAEHQHRQQDQMWSNAALACFSQLSIESDESNETNPFVRENLIAEFRMLMNQHLWQRIGFIPRLYRFLRPHLTESPAASTAVAEEIASEIGVSAVP